MSVTYTSYLVESLVSFFLKVEDGVKHWQSLLLTVTKRIHFMVMSKGSFSPITDSHWEKRISGGLKYGVAVGVGRKDKCEQVRIDRKEGGLLEE